MLVGLVVVILIIVY